MVTFFFPSAVLLVHDELQGWMLSLIKSGCREQVLQGLQSHRCTVQINPPSSPAPPVVVREGGREGGGCEREKKIKTGGESTEEKKGE